MTMTLPSMKPGATDTLFSTSSAPKGMRAMRMRAGVISTPRRLKLSRMGASARSSTSMPTPKALAMAVGGDVVVGRADAAGGEDVVVAAAQRVHGIDDLGLLVGDDAHLLQLDADGGQMVGDVADVLVLGAAREDLVADHQQRRGDDAAAGGPRRLAHARSPVAAAPRAPALGDDLSVERDHAPRHGFSREVLSGSPRGPARSSGLRAPGRRSSRPMAAVSAGASSTGTRRPLTPSAIRAEGPWLAAATSGVPAAHASSITVPNGSQREGSTQMSAAASRAPRSVRQPRKRTRSATPSLAASAFRSASSGPSPAIQAMQPGRSARAARRMSRPFFSCSRERVRRTVASAGVVRAARSTGGPASRVGKVGDVVPSGARHSVPDHVLDDAGRDADEVRAAAEMGGVVVAAEPADDREATPAAPGWRRDASSSG